uniref:Uncharacterized protein n=1 Tax=Falco tinnunculus TaxID=100819 RepID=A0A8C4UEN3_FALTI
TFHHLTCLGEPALRCLLLPITSPVLAAPTALLISPCHLPPRPSEGRSRACLIHLLFPPVMSLFLMAHVGRGTTLCLV